ncbi:hypothetical protein [Pantanalinema sp. GBBB05]|uniref:hypothetical protein n=1 Tax=Pantanalinema sp. GBBB05 TaxID=2604139 RepID=UPI003D819843
MSGLIIRWRSFVKACVATVLVLLLVFSAAGSNQAAIAARKKPPVKPAPTQVSKLSEVAPPPVLLELRELMDGYQPQVKILSPRPNEVLPDNMASVRFQVNDLPLFKDETLGLGPHLHVFLDNQPYQAVYDTSQPLVFENLSPGTHTIRAFASRPWHESFKNEGAYAQTTFHILTKTQEYSPTAEQPLLTYSRPQGTYGAEPIMLDFYLTNAPLHLIAQKDSQDDIPDWRVRCTVNGYSFILDQWQPVYLQGFKPGKNWVQLEFIDENGNIVNNVFNNTARLINYEPNGTDTLSKLVRGELSLVASRGIVDPNYQPPVEEPPAAIELPTPEPTPTPEASPIPEPTPEPTPATPESPLESAKELPTPDVTPSAEPTPTVEIPVTPELSAPAAPTPVPVLPEPIESPIVQEQPAIENSVEAEPAISEETPSEPTIAPTSEELEQPTVTLEPTVAPEPISTPEPVPSLSPVETVKAPELQESPVPAELSAPIEETPVLLVPQPVETPVAQPTPSSPAASQTLPIPVETATPAPVPSTPPAPSATSQVGQQAGKVGRQIGEQAGQLGQKASQFGRQASQRFGQWFNNARQSISKPVAPTVSPSPEVAEPTIPSQTAE